MSFLHFAYIIPLTIIVLSFVVFTALFESRYYKWIRAHWFLKRTIASYVSSLLIVFGLIFLSLILLDPREKEIKVKTPVKKSKTIILIDTSTSMLAEDVRPNRLERAALLAKHFARRASNHQISILIFADITKKLVPFTNDRDLIDARIDSIKEIRNLNAGTSVEKAIAEASRMFNAKDKNISGNILVITDGEDHGQAINIEVPESLKIGFLGVGTPEGGSIPLKDARGMFYGYKKDRAQTVITKLNRKYFDNAVDSKKNRKYFEASITGIPSDEIYSFFSSAEGVSVEEENSIRPLGIKRFAYPGLILIIFGLSLRLFPQLGVALLVLSLNVQAEDIPEEVSRKLEKLKNGDLTKIEKINLADNLVKYKMFDVANEIYSEQLMPSDIKAFQDSYFNWATSLLEKKKHKEAIDRFQSLENISSGNPELTSKIRENIKRAFQQSESEKEENKNKDKNKEQKDQKKEDEQKNQKNENKPGEESSEQDGKGSSGQGQAGDENNNPFNLKEEDQKTENPTDQEKKSQDGEMKEEKENQSQSSKEGEKKGTGTPLLEQLKQDDRKLQIKLLDTSTQGSHDSRKKDW
ncbi:MAG: VWA domain-containing protein [Proteobacteria bacterium]|nr:VWA domain-containing protein [Pseudomonadota bacterium]